MKSDGQEGLELQFRQCPFCIPQPRHQLILLCRLPPAALPLQPCRSGRINCMWCRAGTAVETTGVTGICDLSFEIRVCSAEYLFISLFLLCSRVVVVLHEAVLSPRLEESFELDDNGGRLWLADFRLESAGLLLVEQGSFGGETLVDDDLVQGLLEVLPAKSAVGLTQGLVIQTLPCRYVLRLNGMVCSGVDFNAIVFGACPASILSVLPARLFGFSHGTDAQSFEFTQRKRSFLGLLLCLCLSPQSRPALPSGYFPYEEIPGGSHDATGQGHSVSPESKRSVRFASCSGRQHC